MGNVIMDNVIVLCNNKRFAMGRREALVFFKNAAASSDGHERHRYEYIVECLECGDILIDDELAD